MSEDFEKNKNETGEAMPESPEEMEAAIEEAESQLAENMEELETNMDSLDMDALPAEDKATVIQAFEDAKDAIQNISAGIFITGGAIMSSGLLFDAINGAVTASETGLHMASSGIGTAALAGVFYGIASKINKFRTDARLKNAV